jgi:hypothetical protein
MGNFAVRFRQAAAPPNTEDEPECSIQERSAMVLESSELENTLGHEDWEDLLREAIRVYHTNEVEKDEIYYHVPCCHHYPSLFAWDSGFHAVAMSHIDPIKAARELETLFGQLASDGHLPHEVQLPNNYSRRWMRGLQTRLVSWEYDGRGASYMIDPPSYHFAVETVFAKTRDREWLTRLWPAMASSLDYMLDTRDVLGNGLIAIFHPWESGTDLSPQFFRTLRLKPDGFLSDLRADTIPTLLYAFNHLRKWNARRLARADHFVCQELVINCLAARACLSMANLAGEVGHPREGRRYHDAGRRIMHALDELCWDEEAGCYFPLFGYKRPAMARVVTAASILPVFVGLCPRDRAARMIEAYLCNPLHFWNEHGVPFNTDGNLEGMGPWVENHLWSGHCIWINICWMLAIGLAENGYMGEAREITKRVVRMVLEQGFYEYYDSRTGEGRRIRDFSWPALALDMIARTWPEIVAEPEGKRAAETILPKELPEHR